MLVTRRVQGLILIAVDCFLMIVLSFFFSYIVCLFIRFSFAQSCLRNTKIGATLLSVVRVILQELLRF